ncbi:cell division cycle- protein [Tulasnella sp. 424]|nr:cell division cycle- protein [Tulasnella sp. 424]
MAYYASSSPERPVHPHILTSEPSSPSSSRIDDASFLSTDVDVSFASISVSSQPATPTEEESFLSHQDAMDISPMPPRTSTQRSQPGTSSTLASRPRSRTIGGLNFTRPKSTEERPFGRELSNKRPSSKSPPKAPVTIRNIKASPEAPPVASLFTDPSPSTKPLSARQRVGLPTTWLNPKAAATTRSSKRSPGSIFSKPSALFDSSPEKSCSDVMDLDSSPRKSASSVPFITSSPPRPEPASDNDELGELFFDSASPSAAPILTKKRRSQDDIKDQENRALPKGQRSSSPPKSGSGARARPRSSSPPSESPCLKRTSGTSRPFERFNTTGGAGTLLFGQPSGGRKGPVRRPGINPLSSTGDSTANGPKSASAGLYGTGRRLPSSFTGVPPSRRALSAQVPMKEVISLAKYNAPTAGDETEPEEESSFEVSICSPIPARRHGPQRSISYAQAPFAAAPGRSMLAKLQDATVSTAPDDDDDVEIPVANGLPGCRDSETHGKILPCFKVKEDGIVRITPATLENLLRGEYDDHLKAFHIIDCRFDYEFEGGHIDGATNFTTPEDAADYFLNQLPVPPPSSSGDPSPDGELKTVLVFHCEFSAKRGPTFAKHLRAQDRKSCHEAYPRVHYPEVYILQGGYKSFWESHPHRCGGYTEMDDPNHVEARREKIDTMRKWERTRSYTYGERTAAVTALGNNKAAAASAPEPLPQRTGESTSSLGKATGGVPTRRPAVAALSTLVEHHEADTSFADSDCSFTGGVGDSPCPANMASKKNTVRPVLGRRAPLGRASTMGPLVFSLKA